MGSFSVPAIFGNPFLDNNCFFALRSVDRDYKYNNTQLSFDVYSTIASPDSSSFYYYEVACYISCPNFTIVTLESVSQCLFCSSLIPNCLYCSSSRNCTQCLSVSYVNSDNFCTLCRRTIPNCFTCTNSTHCSSCLLGRWVVGGCTKVVGCTSAVQVNHPNRSIICLSCDDNSFNYNQTSRVCNCKFGWIVGNYCTTIHGCVSTSLQSSVVICNFCSVSEHYVLDPVSHTCNCAPGYYKNDSDQCPQVCGDGLVLELQCDDGNTIDGDGCSSKCTV